MNKLSPVYCGSSLLIILIQAFRNSGENEWKASMLSEKGARAVWYFLRSTLYLRKLHESELGKMHESESIALWP